MICGFCKGAQNHVFMQNGKLEWVICPVCQHFGVRNPVGNGTTSKDNIKPTPAPAPIPADDPETEHLSRTLPEESARE